MLTSFFHVDLSIDFVHLMSVFLLYNLPYGEADPEHVELPIEENLVPQDGDDIDLKAVGKQRREPGMQKHVARCLILNHVFVQ